jgi:uncharacterized protein YcbX
VQLGTLSQCWRYPFKSMQGASVSSLDIGTHGVAGDRAYALMDCATGKVLSAKAVKLLLDAAADDEQVQLPDGTAVELGSPDRDEVLSAWLGRDVTVLHLEQGEVPEPGLAYEMTFDPPDDDAEMYDIELPAHGFVDLAPLHLVATSTLDGCRSARPDLDWDVRRFRPNLVLDHDGPTFAEDDWVGSRLAIGDRCVVAVAQPTVRCAMPLRAQPAGPDGGALERQPALFAAMNELHAAAPNHLGAYLDVVAPGPVRVGDPVVLLAADTA